MVKKKKKKKGEEKNPNGAFPFFFVASQGNYQNNEIIQKIK